MVLDVYLHRKQKVFSTHEWIVKSGLSPFWSCGSFSLHPIKRRMKTKKCNFDQEIHLPTQFFWVRFSGVYVMLTNNLWPKQSKRHVSRSLVWDFPAYQLPPGGADREQSGNLTLSFVAEATSRCTSTFGCLKMEYRIIYGIPLFMAYHWRYTPMVYRWVI